MTPSLKPWMAALILSALPALTVAAPPAVAPPVAAPAVAPAEQALPPSWQRSQRFGELGSDSDLLLLGIRPSAQVEFGLRRDRLATAARLQLEFTPSPSLLPGLSHLRVYLNDRLMGVLAVDREHPGQAQRGELALDPRLLTDFNRLRLEFVGHYAEVCEDPSNSALWLSVSRDSRLLISEQALSLGNDLARFPAPFFDARERAALRLPMVFAAAPSLAEQRAGALLASYFGSLAGWRGARFPVLYDRLPASEGAAPQSAVVFASEEHRPAFLADRERFPAVDGPVLQLINHPDAPWAKLLLVRGRDDADLQRAVEALLLGGPLLRGSQVAVGELTAPAPRSPYDAPNWVRTDRAVRFAELLDYPQQLQVSGAQPAPIGLDLNLPPDLFVWRNTGIPLRLHYRYSIPGYGENSRLNVSLNDQFIAGLALQGREQRSGLEQLRLAVGGDADGPRERLLVPSLKVGDRNRLSLAFNFDSLPSGAQRDHCQSPLPLAVHASLDEDSSIDFSGYPHYLAMPDLRAFARSGFPFSRMADLSETLVLLPRAPGEELLATLLETLGALGAQIGYPAYGVRLSDDPAAALQADADLLVFGAWPAALGEGSELQLAAPYERLLPGAAVRSLPSGRALSATVAARGSVEIAAEAPLAALLGRQSPQHPQRSVVALLAQTPADFALLRDSLADPALRGQMAGSLALMRSSGVTSQFLGEPYYVGTLSWWQLLWFHLADHPLLLAGFAALGVLLGAFLFWYLLRGVARRRLGED
jgi:hypothetical protein